MQRPVGVAIIAVLCWFWAFWIVVFGAVLALGFTFFSAVTAGLPAILSGMGVIGGLFLIGLGAAISFLGYGLFTMREWARMATVVLAVVGMVTGLLGGIGIFGRLFRVLINGLIVWYLTQSRIRMSFRR
jgi:hypothetical protein